MPFTVVKAIGGQGQIVVTITEVVEDTEKALEDLQWEKGDMRFTSLTSDVWSGIEKKSIFVLSHFNSYTVTITNGY